MKEKTRVLVVDDEPQIRRALRLVLRANGCTVTDVATGEAALDAMATQPFDLVILDLVLPDIDGVEVCRRLREWSRLPVIVLSVHGEEQIKIRALNEGADDYVTKPFSAPELLARMGSTLRRASWEAAPAEPVVYADDGAVEIDLARRLVSRDMQEVHLTPIEFELLSFLTRHAGRVITHGHLLRSALGPSYDGATGTLRVHIASLRKKLEADPAHPRIIVTEPGIGYRLRADSSTPMQVAAVAPPEPARGIRDAGTASS
ncbi:MAG: two-component system, OmpR family, operon response regulator KdpE [Chloroflexota bacterium]|nr:two-component system, OmpR family, operon response regulator KdpE [Chloroflexota bacterium]